MPVSVPEQSGCFPNSLPDKLLPISLRIPCPPLLQLTKKKGRNRRFQVPVSFWFAGVLVRADLSLRKNFEKKGFAPLRNESSVLECMFFAHLRLIATLCFIEVKSL